MSTAVVLALVTFVSLKQVTCDVSEVLGYNYLPPQPPPVQFDEPSTPPNTYLPPIFQDDIFPAAPAPGYLPPAFYPPLGTPPSDPNDDDTVVVPAPTPISLYQAVPPQMKILNMSCVLDTSFKTSFRLERKGSNFPIPVVDNGMEDCVRFDPQNTFFIDVEGRKKLSECGVLRCTSGTSSRSNMCVTIRMPAIRGIKLPEDGLVTLQCTPQDPVVSHTKHISLSPMTSSKGRSTNNVVVASGGSQRNFDSRLLLLRKSGRSGNFDQPLQPGSIVILGEELVLRAVVQDGDGWKFSRLGPVMVRSPNSKKSVTLVEENGCRSPGMKSICPHQPQQLSPLDTHLHFRAFLFQDSSRKQDMLLSVRMLGCIHPQDCYQNGPCSDDNLAPPLRFKRDAGGNSSLEKNGTSDWKSQFIFKVQMPEEPNQPVKTVSVSIEFLLLASMFTFCLIAIIILATIHLVRKQSRQNVR